MAIRIIVWIQGLFSGFVTTERYGKWLTDINLLLILIRQMVALVRRALAEVRTVPVILVYYTAHLEYHGITPRHDMFKRSIMS